MSLANLTMCPETYVTERGLSTFILLSSSQPEAPLQKFFFSKFQHLCLLCPKSPPRCPALSPSLHSPSTGHPCPLAHPPLGQTQTRLAPPLPPRQAPALAGTDYVPL